MVQAQDQAVPSLKAFNNTSTGEKTFNDGKPAQAVANDCRSRCVVDEWQTPDPKLCLASTDDDCIRRGGFAGKPEGPSGQQPRHSG